MESAQKDPDIPERKGVEPTKTASSSITQLAANVMLGLKETVLSKVSATENHTTTTCPDSDQSDTPGKSNPADTPSKVDNTQDTENADAVSKSNTKEGSQGGTPVNDAASLLLKASESVTPNAVSNESQINPQSEDVIVEEGRIRNNAASLLSLLQNHRVECLSESTSPERREKTVDEVVNQFKKGHPKSRFLRSLPNEGGWKIMNDTDARDVIRTALQEDPTKTATSEGHASAEGTADEVTPVPDGEANEANPQDYRLSDVIVIGGKIADATEHEGNQRLIELIRIWGNMYASASYPEKDEVAEKVMKTVTEFSHPPGRFLQPEWKTGRWVFFPMDKARVAIHRALEYNATPHLLHPYAIPRAQDAANRNESSRSAASHQHLCVVSAESPSEGSEGKEDDTEPFEAMDDGSDGSNAQPNFSASSPGFGTTSQDRKESAKAPMDEDGSEEAITHVRSNDVLRGRGGIINQHEGNKAFRRDIKENHIAYSVAATKEEKNDIVYKVLNQVVSRGGRFLNPHKTKPACWMESSWEDAKRKTSQALREGASDVRKKMGVDSVVLALARKEKKKARRSSVGKVSTGLGKIEASPVTDTEDQPLPDAVPSTEGEAGGLCSSEADVAPGGSDEKVSPPSTYVDYMDTNGGVKPQPNDVLSGRGGRVNSHPGNVLYRKHIHENRVAYSLATTEAEKAGLIRHVIQQIRNQDPPGRFLFRDYQKQQWVEAPEERWIRKTSQALREGAPKIRLAYGGNSSKLRVKRTTKRRIETLADLSEFSEAPPAGQSPESNKRPNTTDNSVTDNTAGIREAAELLGGLGQASSKD